MANCCTCLSKSANIIFCLLLFVIGGFVAGVGIWYLVSDYKDWVPEWWIWIAVITGILLAILSFVGCYGSLKRNKCVLSFLWVASTVLFILFAIAAIASTIFFAGVDNLNGKTAQQLLEVSGNDGNVYKQIRDGYIAVFTDDDCNVKCSVDDGKLYCGSITCESEGIEDQLNRWIGPSWWTTDVNSFEKCVAAATVEDNANEMAAEAWCASNTYAIDWFWRWILGTMIVLWFIVVFTLFMAVGNCVLMWSHSHRKDAVVMAPKAEMVRTPPMNGFTVVKV
ncbi:Tetraspanin-4, putative [Perkinsus marinus ATCC 50983]|uniref:Tetraspanin-4, putative n=1 Tax=Perkinsus marinus (strain ATCC 50983 / TXsc) TaxID=423536 RepID=C5LEW9_PERM5|nr:Tetraspanin-4, putative [Perkinsus marinus ATCC 50983]EER04735.1 Tetraspanin-4, putative [Perkinsus marinus ATCC 50983]|eukprot:XP_002772919.1 Tetraspanin-4, putative [Perkinsus marinus ATCC 50983]